MLKKVYIIKNYNISLGSVFMILKEMYGAVLVSDVLKSPVEYHHSDLIKKRVGK